VNVTGDLYEHGAAYYWICAPNGDEIILHVNPVFVGLRMSDSRIGKSSLVDRARETADGVCSPYVWSGVPMHAAYSRCRAGRDGSPGWVVFAAATVDKASIVTWSVRLSAYRIPITVIGAGVIGALSVFVILRSRRDSRPDASWLQCRESKVN
jgi:hypothetical protein